jgi:hypothetical protein
MLNHFYNLSQNLVTSVIKFLIDFLVEIVVPEGKRVGGAAWGGSAFSSLGEFTSGLELGRQAREELFGGFNDPDFRMLNHFYDLSQNLVTSVIKFLIDFLAEIVVPESNLDMNLGLGSFGLCFIELCHKRSLISPPSPSFR